MGPEIGKCDSLTFGFQFGPNKFVLWTWSIILFRRIAIEYGAVGMSDLTIAKYLKKPFKSIVNDVLSLIREIPRATFVGNSLIRLYNIALAQPSRINGGLI